SSFTYRILCSTDRPQGIVTLYDLLAAFSIQGGFVNRLRLAFCVLVLCGLSVIGAAQEERTPVATTSSAAEKIRFAGAASSMQIRIEVRSSAGALLYDSDWKDGNILDWLPRDSSGQPLAYGAYRLVMKSKNLAGETSEREAALRVDSSGMSIDGQT